MDYSTFTTRINAEIDDQNDLTLTLVKQITVRQLKELSSFRTLFMESTFTFSTVASQDTYDSAVSGFPSDIMQIDRLYYESGSARYEIPGPNSMDEMRFGGFTLNPSQYPEAWGWHAQKLVLAPTPSGTQVLKADYFKDATRDTSTGAIITESSTSQTNGWFDRGEIPLRYAVFAEFYSHPKFRDVEAAASCIAQRNQYLDTLKTEWMVHKNWGVQTPFVMGDFDEAGA